MTTQLPIVIEPGHPAFAGHFPGAPIVPGVVLLDEVLYAIATASGLSLAHCTLGTVKFVGVVRPGQALQLRFEAAAGAAIRFELASDGRMVASGTVTLAGAARNDG